jgi:hypothetical protein
MGDMPIKLRPSDDGTVFNASNHGGTTLPRVSLQLIFWGSAWPNPPGGPTANQIIAATHSILRGPYLSSLLQYGVYLGTLRGTTFVSSDPPNPFSSNDWHNQIWDMIDNGTFPEPDDSGGLNLYMLIPQPGTLFSNSGLGGQHGSPWDYDFPLDIDYAYAGWAGWSAGQSTLDNLTTNLSHEIVEACTDAEAQHNDAWTIDGRSHPNNEICDVCEQTSAAVNGFMMQGYWSNFDRGCIVPTVFSVKRFMRMKGLDPSKGLKVINPPVTSVLAFILAG